MNQALLASVGGLGISFGSAELLVTAAVFVILAIAVIWIMKKLIVNSILGIIALAALNWLGLKIEITFAAFIVTAVLGLFGVALLVVFHLLGIKV